MHKHKIDILKEMIRNNKIESCSIIGKPTKELYNFYFAPMSLSYLFDGYEIEYREDEFGDTSIRIYCNPINKDVCMVTINDPTEKQIDLIVDNLLETFIDCTQKRLLPALFDKITGSFPSKLNFSDMLFLIPEKTQASVCEKIGRSPQALSDIKSGKNNLTIEILSKLMNLYPLLPWEHFIKDITKD